MAADLNQAHLDEIIKFRRDRLFNFDHGELSRDESYLFHLLVIATQTLKKFPLPPLLLLEIFIYTHKTGHPQLSFVVDWLYKAAIEFHQAEGEEHFERGLGFTAKDGRRSGQGHEFKTLRREQEVEYERLYTWIRMLNIFEGCTVEQAVNITQQIHAYGREKFKRHKKALSYETILRGYKAWRGKKSFDEEEDLFREHWEAKDKKTSREKLFKTLEILKPKKK